METILKFTAESPALSPKPDDYDQWWESFYDDAAMRVLASKTACQVQADVDVILKVTRRDDVIDAHHDGCRQILDQCCGLGQHAVELASRGHAVLGIDQASAYIERAMQSASKTLSAKDSIRFETHDATTYRHQPCVDLVYNWHSSFGYLANEKENLRMIEMASLSLRPGGRFLLEYPNIFHLLANFQPVMADDVDDTLRLNRTSTIDAEQSTLFQTWTYKFADGRQRSHHSRFQLYLPNQLRRMLQEAGLGSIRVFSGSGETLTLQSPRCLVLGVKP